MQFKALKFFLGGLGPYESQWWQWGWLRAPPRPSSQLHLGMLMRACSLRSLSQLGSHGPNYNFLVDALKIKSFGILGDLLELIKNLLSNRFQRVVLNAE